MQLIMQLIMRRLMQLFIGTSIGALLACGESRSRPVSSPEPSDRQEDDEKQPDVKIKEVNPGVDGIDSYQRVQMTAFVVKNNLQLRAAADTCLGPGLGIIQDDMFAPRLCSNARDLEFIQTRPPNPNENLNGNPDFGGDKFVILGADKCGARGQHIFDVLQDRLWSPDLAGRTDTLANQLTPNYLQALATAADVYAHGVAQPMMLCDTMERAQDLVSKCLGQYPLGAREAVAQLVNRLCSQGPIKAREAIASILGSAAFAAATVRDGGKK